MTDDEFISTILDTEGGFSNDPLDRGSATKYGVTRETLGEFRRTTASIADVEALTRSEATNIYRTRYLEAPGLDHIADDRLRHLMLDSAVQHGPGQAVKFLQRALHVPDDGILGPLTLHALASSADDAAVYDAVWAQRALFYAHIVKHDPSQRRFAGGWFTRLAEFA